MDARDGASWEANGERTDIVQPVLVEERSDTPAAQGLLSDFVATIKAHYPDFDPDIGPSATPEDFSAPHGAFFVAYLGGQPVGCCGVKFIDEHVAEMKWGPRLHVSIPASASSKRSRCLHQTATDRSTTTTGTLRRSIGSNGRCPKASFAGLSQKPIVDSLQEACPRIGHAMDSDW